MRWSAESIQKLRRKLSLSQERFADEVGVSVRTVNRWETGKSLPRSLIVIQRLDQLEERARQGGAVGG